MKTEKQVKTWIDIHGTKVIMLDDHQEIVAGLEARINRLREALKAIDENTVELQPNSGHMYLANVNYCHKKARQALKDDETGNG